MLELTKPWDISQEELYIESGTSPRERDFVATGKAGEASL